MEEKEFDIEKNLDNTELIVVDKLQKKYGWTNDGYSFTLNSKDAINKIDDIETFTLNIENNEVESKVECTIPKIDNFYSIDCIAKKSDISGEFKILDNVIPNKKTKLPKLAIMVPSNKLLDIEKKQEDKKLSKGAKIGIIIGAVVFIGICVAFIIMYKIRLICKRNGPQKEKGYDIAPDKSMNIPPWEDKKNDQFDAIKIKNQNENLKK